MYNTIDKQKFGQIQGLSQIRRMPLLGKIRLGIKKKSEKSGKEYPAEVEYFVVPPEVQKEYGEQPRELDVMFPVAAKHVIFNQAYRWYGSSTGIKCMGNGVEAMRRDENNKFCERTCPCEKLKGCEDFDMEYAKEHSGELPKKECVQRAYLLVVLPKISMGGVYQISTSSYNSIVDINSGLDYAEAMIGRYQWVPMKLVREKIETHHWFLQNGKALRAEDIARGLDVSRVYPQDPGSLLRGQLGTRAPTLGPARHPVARELPQRRVDRDRGRL